MTRFNGVPTFVFEGRDIQDLRPIKTDQLYKASAPDFREPGQGGKAWWPPYPGRDETPGYHDVKQAADIAHPDIAADAAGYTYGGDRREPDGHHHHSDDTGTEVMHSHDRGNYFHRH